MRKVSNAGCLATDDNTSNLVDHHSFKSGYTPLIREILLVSDIGRSLGHSYLQSRQGDVKLLSRMMPKVTSPFPPCGKRALSWRISGKAIRSSERFITDNRTQYIRQKLLVTELQPGTHFLENGRPVVSAPTFI